MSKMKEYKCKLCDKIFLSYHNKRVYCSMECMSKGYRKDKIKVECDNCHKEYEIYPSTKKWHDLRGCVHFFCSKKCTIEYQQLENHPAWIKDRSKIKDRDHSIRESVINKKWRESVFERDDYTCQLCHDKNIKGKGLVINAHHIKSFANYINDRFDINNGITLCIDCHKWVHRLNPQDQQ